MLAYARLPLAVLEADVADAAPGDVNVPLPREFPDVDMVDDASGVSKLSDSPSRDDISCVSTSAASEHQTAPPSPSSAVNTGCLNRRQRRTLRQRCTSVFCQPSPCCEEAFSHQQKLRVMKDAIDAGNHGEFGNVCLADNSKKHVTSLDEAFGWARDALKEWMSTDGDAEEYNVVLDTLTARLNSTRISTSFSGIDAPGTAVEEMELAIREMIDSEAAAGHAIPTKCVWSTTLFPVEWSMNANLNFSCIQAVDLFVVCSTT